MHPGMAIDASRDGDRSIPGWQSMHPGLTIDATGMAITASLVGDQGWRSINPGIAIGASRDGNRRTRDDDRSIPGWQSFHPGMASRDRARCITGWRSPGWYSGILIRHPGMAIDASLDGDPCIRRWRSIYHGMASQHPWMAIDASRDGDH